MEILETDIIVGLIYGVVMAGRMVGMVCSNNLRTTENQNFGEVVNLCAKTHTKIFGSTLVSKEFIYAYFRHHETGIAHLHPSKPVQESTNYYQENADARISVKPDKPRQMNYTAQTVVDTSHHVITNIQADHSDKRDSQSLAAVVKQTKENLEPHGLQVEELLADTGYSSGTALAYLEEQNITGFIHNFGQYKHERRGFIYNQEKDQYERGNKALLPYRGTDTDPLGYTKKKSTARRIA